MTWIKHPDLPGQPVEVPDLAVPHYRAAGWEITEAPPKPKKLAAKSAAADDKLEASEPSSGAPQSAPSADGESADDKTDTETESPRTRRRTTKED
jgi:hypothetical protein